MALDIHIQSLRAGSKVLVRDLHVHCAAGHVVTLMGASGSGKSSLLAAVCGTLESGVQFNGDVLLGGQSVAGLPCAQRHIGMLFQDDLLFAHMTVRENLLFAVPAGHRADREAAVQQALEDLGFLDMAHRSPTTLSGGQRALLDEPFSKLDAALRQQFREFVFAHARQQALPTLLVTHDTADIADPALVVYL
jgi:putative thiamine transport system ATP-binding protein